MLGAVLGHDQHAVAGAHAELRSSLGRVGQRRPGRQSSGCAIGQVDEGPIGA
jgi:hypothetical protein